MKWLLLFAVTVGLCGACTSRPLELAPIAEPQPLDKVTASKSFLGSSLNRPLPISNAEIQKLLTHLEAPSSCAALYQQLISRGADKAWESWQKRDLNFELACIPSEAKEAFDQCQALAAKPTAAGAFCQKAMGMTRAFLIQTVLAQDERPLVAALKAAHELYLLQDVVAQKPEAVLALTEILLSQQARELDAHLLRVEALRARGAQGEEKKALDTSLRWLALSSEKRHKLAVSVE